MQHRGDLSVLTALRDGEPVVIIAPGGGLRCVVNLGAFVSLARAKLKAPRKIIAASGGGCNSAAFCSEKPELAGEELAKVFGVYEHIAVGGFLRVRHTPWGWPYFHFDDQELIRTLRGERKHLGLPSYDQAAINAHPSELLMVATDNTTGNAKFLSGKPDVFPALTATIAVQGTCKPVIIDGVEHGDGAIGLSVKEVVRKFRARNVLVLANSRVLDDQGAWEYYLAPMLTQLMLSQFPRGVREKAAQMDSSFAKDMRRIAACTRIRKLFVYPDASDPYLMQWTPFLPWLKQAYENAANYMEGLIEKARAY